MKAVFIKSCSYGDFFYIFLYIDHKRTSCPCGPPYTYFIIVTLLGNIVRGPCVPGR